MHRELPANPLSIQLTVAHERLWWQTEQTDEQPERWEVSADIWGMEEADYEARHVGDISLALADLAMERNLTDSAMLGDWAVGFIADLVTDSTFGVLHPDLESRFTPGPAHLVVINNVSVTEPWRGHGVGAALTASTLLVFSRYARLAACHVSPHDLLSTGHDPVSAELASARLGMKLESIGFERWHDAYIVDLRSPILREARRRVIRQWWPNDEETGPL